MQSTTTARADQLAASLEGPGLYTPDQWARIESALERRAARSHAAELAELEAIHRQSTTTR